jgi:hypothetical protein
VKHRPQVGMLHFVSDFVIISVFLNSRNTSHLPFFIRMEEVLARKLTSPP